MSGGEPPFDGDARTVISPSPEDRTRIDVPAAPGHGSGGAPAAEPTMFFPGGAPAAAGVPEDATVLAGAFPAPGLAPEDGGAAEIGRPDDDRLRLPSRNPLLAAAAPILTWLARMEGKAAPADAPDLLAAAIRRFEKQAGSTGVPRQDARIARYALCETADEIGRSLPGADPEAWAREGMLATFFKTRDVSGTGFFEALNKVLSDPAPNADLLELMHACLSLGFQGQYRGVPGGAAALEAVRRDVFAAMSRVRPIGGSTLSPHWQGLSAPVAKTRRLPVWTVGAAAAALVGGLFFLLRVTITAEGEAVAATLRALNPTGPVAIERGAVPPPEAPPPQAPEPAKSAAQLDRIRAALASEIEAGGIGATERGDAVVVEISNSRMFDPGSATLKPGFDATAARLAAMLEAERGPVRIVGHTDNVKPRKSSPFKSNFDLSVARAEAVKAALAPELRDAARLATEGKGEDEPIADNGTPEGRAANRRIELILTRETPP